VISSRPTATATRALLETIVLMCCLLFLSREMKAEV
jgi:hypothetical protein